MNETRKLLFLFLLLFSVTIADATVFRIPKDTYQDFNGEWRVFDSQNISQYPLYTITENPSTYTITRQGETFELKKSEAEYDFSYNTITPYSKNLNGKKPFILSYDENVFKIKDEKLKSEKFTWNPEVEVFNDSETEDVKKEKIKGSIGNGKITYDIPDWANSVRENTITINNATTSGWTANVTLTNSTRDLSSGNVTSGFFWDTFDDNIIASVWTKVGSVTEANGYLNTTGSSAGVTTPSVVTDNFNASVDIKTVRNGALDGHVPQFIYLYGTTNYTDYYIQRNNITVNAVVYKSVAAGATNGTYDRFAFNNLKIYTYGDTVDGYVNGILDSKFVHANVSKVKAVPNLLYAIGNGGSAAVIGHWDNLRYWQNNTGTIDIWQQNASAGNAVNRTRIVAYNLDANLTIDLYSKANSSASWTLIQANISNNTWYDIPRTVASKSPNSASQDFRMFLNGNSSDAPIFSELEWDESAIIPAPSITNLTSTLFRYSLYFNWSNPSDSDYNYTVIYFDGIWHSNTSGNSITFSDLQPQTTHTISIYTVDTNGNANTTWINATSTTLNPDTGGGSGGGSGSYYYIYGGNVTINSASNSNSSNSINPPMIDIFQTIKGAKIAVINEGKNDQEYIINWNLFTGKSIIDSATMSKLIKPGERFELPLEFKKFNDPYYTLEVIIQYGMYQSKTSKTIVTGKQSSFNIEFLEDIDKRTITVISLMVLILSVFIFTSRNPHKRRNHRR